MDNIEAVRAWKFNNEVHWPLWGRDRQSM